MSELPPHQVRPGEPGDRGYILDSWLKSYRGGPEVGASGREPTQTPHMALPGWAYWSRFGHVGLVEEIARYAVFDVACLASDAAWLYGWVAYFPSPLVLHYVFVRREYQRQGFGRLLLRQAVGDAQEFTTTHETAEWRARLDKGRARFVNPYRAERR